VYKIVILLEWNKSRAWCIAREVVRSANEERSLFSILELSCLIYELAYWNLQ
jgi:hypothetical protein